VRPNTNYAKSGSIQIAYQITGSGPIDIVYAPGMASHLDLDWEWPPKARFFEQLSSFCRLIRFDKRGTGLSDRPTIAATLEERIDDIRAVMDAANCEKAVLYGASEGGSMAALFAATYPARTRALVLWGTVARWTRTPDHRWGLTEEEYLQQADRLGENGVTPEYLTGSGAGLGAADPAYLDWFVRYARAGASPAAFAALERMNSQIDLRDILPAIQAPTLVMNRTGDPAANVDAARDLASRIPGARFIEWPGASHQMLDLTDEIVPIVEEFVTGTHTKVSSDRVLATILLLDIVESTGQVARLGDTTWRSLLARANETSQQIVAAFRGRRVKNTGDGFLALFDGPSRAIQCAKAVRQDFRSLGLQTRIGLHTGECEVIGEDVAGIAVHLTARIMAAATPDEILMSSTVRDLVAGASLNFEDRGLVSLKGFEEKRQLLAVV
jgi:pimeloyl-ACP methyl ester carboxylesterase